MYDQAVAFFLNWHLRALVFLPERLSPRPIFFRPGTEFDSSPRFIANKLYHGPRYVHTRANTSRKVSPRFPKRSKMRFRAARTEIARLLVKSSRKLVAKVVRESSTSVKLARSLPSPYPSFPRAFGNKIRICNSREDGPQFSGRAHSVVRFSIISATSRCIVHVRVLLLCAFLCVCVYLCVRMEHVYAVLQRDLRRMKVLRMNVEPRARPSRNDISRRKFEGWRMRLFTDESLWYFPQYMCAYIRTCAMYTWNIEIIRFSTDKYRAPFPRCFIAIISHFNFRYFKFKNFKFFRSKNFNNRIENIIYILLAVKDIIFL